MHLLPRFPADGSAAWKLEVSLDGGPAQSLQVARGLQTDAAWAQGVLSNRLSPGLSLSGREAGPVRITLRAEQGELMVDGVEALRGA